MKAKGNISQLEKINKFRTAFTFISMV
jgi:hypothetical protein